MLGRELHYACPFAVPTRLTLIYYTVTLRHRAVHSVSKPGLTHIFTYHKRTSVLILHTHTHNEYSKCNPVHVVE